MGEPISVENTDIEFAPELPKLGPLAECSLADLLDAVERYVRSFVVLSAAQSATVTVWVAHCYAIEKSETTPYMAVTSAERRSGKSRLEEVVEQLVPDPVRAANISDAALFRLLSERPRVLLLDEVDAIFSIKGNREDLRALLNSSYRRGSPTYRVVGEGSKRAVEAFEAYGAKMLAGIDNCLPDTIVDRSFPIRLKRKTSAETVQRFRLRDASATAAPIRAALERWRAVDLDDLDSIRPELPVALDDRAQDAAEPLLAIADLAGADWPARLRAALVALRSEQSEPDDETIGVRLLSDIAAAFELESTDRLGTERLLEILTADEEAPWGDWYGKPLSPRRLARLLKPYGIHSKALRIGDKAGTRGYRLDDLGDAFSRYIPSGTATSATPEDPYGFSTDPETQHDPTTLHFANPDFRLEQADVADVAERPLHTGQADVFGAETDRGVASDAVYRLRHAAALAEELGDEQFGARLRQSAFRLASAAKA